MTLNRILIVGASLAGTRAAQSIRRQGFDGDLTIIGGEPDGSYDRPPLSKKYLCGRASDADIALRVSGYDARWLTGVSARKLDTVTQTVLTDQDETLPYDRLVVATGAKPRQLPQFNVDPDRNIFELRTLEDARRLRAALHDRPRVAIIGAGFIGVEIASACCEIGCDEVHLIAPIPPLASLGTAVSDKARQLCQQHGVRIWDGLSAAGLKSNNIEHQLIFDDDSSINTDIIVIAVGAEPEVGWLEGSGLDLADGIRCDQNGFAKNVENVLAAGDVASWERSDNTGAVRVEHWSNAAEQGMLAGRNAVTGPNQAVPTQRITSIWCDHFGSRVQSIGTPSLATREEIVIGSIDNDSFIAEQFRDNDLVAVVGYNDSATITKSRQRLLQQSS